ncbi:MAG: DMT family transporter [Planctomycetota bacterium]
MNGQLGRSVGHPMQASMISFASGVGIVFLICVISGLFPPKLQVPAGELPWWIWFGGAIGVVMVTTSLIFVPRVGSLTWFAAVMTGQTVGAIILDHYGWLGNERASASPLRLIGSTLLIAGVMVIVVAKRQESRSLDGAATQEAPAEGNLASAGNPFDEAKPPAKGDSNRPAP